MNSVWTEYVHYAPQPPDASFTVTWGGGGVRGGCENVRPENNFSKNREREITFTEIREREIRR